ncbi:polysaccharide biosynthesis C-terminal domain-containing protein [Candidatus Woesearchaeota archaeon]|nr:polysaccharide biosynthesis C-terminal domain-containing protein [Candidatus Woesearchaeota archaeon]
MNEGKKETLYYFVLNIASKAIVYLMLLVFANFFTKEAYGRASFIISIFYIILMFTMLGMPNTMISWIVKRKDTSSVFYFLLLITGITIAAGSIFSYIYNYVWILPLIFALLFLLITNFGLALFRVNHKHHFFQLYYTIVNLSILILAYFFQDGGAAGIVNAYALTYIWLTLPIVFFNRHQIWRIVKRVRIDFEVIRLYFIKGLATSLLVSSIGFLMWVDSSILGLISTFENVAKYSVVSSISNGISIFSASISVFMLTRSAEVEDAMLSKNILNRSTRLAIFFSVSVALVLNSLIFILMKLFFKQYIGTEIFVMILSTGMIFYSITMLQCFYLTGALRQEIALAPIGIAAIINIVLDFILVPYFGLYGICIATAFAHFFAFFWLSSRMNQLREIWLLLLILWMIPLAYYMGIYGMFLIFVAIPILFKLKLIEKEDLNVVKNTFLSIIKR